jgi:cytochrome P450
LQKDEYINVLESALKGGGIGAELPLVRAIGRYLPFEVCRTLFAANTYLVQKAAVAVTNADAGGEKTPFAHIMREADKGEKLDDLDLKLEASGLIVAGSDTTAISLTYLVWAVLSRPDLTRMLQQEVGVLPDDYTDGHLEELPLLNAVIEETLRLYGAAPGGLPRAVPPGGVHLGGFFLPGGTTVTTQAYTMHRDPRIFPNPLE